MEQYDPSVQEYLRTCESRWGNPEQNRDMLVPYGIKPLDMAFYGLDIANGEMITIQGEEGTRKTTIVENIVTNYMLKPIKLRPVTVVDLLESGMKPAKYFDNILANVASRYLMLTGHQPNPTIVCHGCGGDGPCKEMRLSHKFLKYNTRSATQMEAIEWAKDQMQGWPLYVFGPTADEGDTRNLETSVIGTKGQKSRWQRLIEEIGAKVFVCDHLQQYDLSVGEYEKMQMVIPAHSNIVARYNIVEFMISQVSLTSAREASSGMGKYTAAGGRKAAQESNIVLTTNYESGAGKMALTVEKGRDAGTFSIWQSIEENSGAMYGEATRVAKLEYRPGMGQAQQASAPQVRGRRN